MTTRVSRHSFLTHLSRLGSVAGICVLGYAIAWTAPVFVRPALVLFVVSAISACAGYAIRNETEDARREETLFISLALSLMLGVLSLTWLFIYRGAELPLDVAWFALTVALLTAAFQRAA